VRPTTRTAWPTLFCYALSFTGCRISEALQLVRERIDFDAGACFRIRDEPIGLGGASKRTGTRE
jgi:integrase